MGSNEKIGVGIVTCNRPEYLHNLLNSLEDCRSQISELVIVNDGKPLTDLNPAVVKIINNETNIGVGKSKNKAIQSLLNAQCDYIFIIEDDMIVVDKTVFKKYIEAYKTSGIHHFNYGPSSPFNRKQTIKNFDLHNRHLLDEETDPNPKLVVDYKNLKISLYQHITGTFSFFTRESLTDVGLIDEDYYNAWEHVDHTNRLIKAGYHPPFWWFADVHDSHKFITSQRNAIKNSSTSKNTEQWLKNVQTNAELYKSKNGYYPAQTPQTSQADVVKFLKSLKPTHG